MNENPETARSYYRPSDEGAVDLRRMIILVLKKWWLMLLVGIIFATAGFTYAKLTYKEVYQSSATVSLQVVRYTMLNDGSEPMQRIDFYTGSDVERYQIFLTSDRIVDKIVTKLGNRYSNAQIKNAMSVNARIEGGDIFDICVTGADKQFCADVLSAALSTFPEYLNELNNSLIVSVVNDPRTYVANSSGSAKTAIVCFLAGVVLIAAAVVLTDIFSGTVKKAEELRSKLDVAVLGSIPEIENKKKKKNKNKKGQNTDTKAQPLLLLTDEDRVNFSFVESFKSVRTKVERASSDKGYKVFMVTSTLEDEGKTTVCANLACALAQKGNTVLLIDCDFRKPAVTTVLGLEESTENGLLPLLEGKSTFSKSVQYVKEQNIFVLPTGGVSDRSSELLDTPRMKRVLQNAKEEFDYVLIDTPPSKVVTDAAVLAPLADSVVYVVRQDFAKATAISESVDELLAVHGRVLGSVFTMVSGAAALHGHVSSYYLSSYRRYGGYGKYSYHQK